MQECGFSCRTFAKQTKAAEIGKLHQVLGGSTYYLGMVKY